MAAYSVSKHAVVALSEVLQHDLRQFGSNVGVSVLCPAYVPTRIAEAERNRPAGYVAGEKSAKTLEQQAMLKKAVASGKLTADDVARAVVRAVKEDRFYVLTHPAILGAVRARMEDILEGRTPRDPMSLR
jgi:NAD(P)-dependent dehydrogenase (short-subunit alcohol dehydrogenase family)